MHRRSVLALAAVTPLAGCSDLLGGGAKIDATVSDGNPHEFSASEGDELSVSVTVTEVDQQNEDDAETEVTSISFRLGPQDGAPILAESIEEGAERTFSVTVENDGTHIVAVTNGAADVVVESA